MNRRAQSRLLERARPTLMRRLLLSIIMLLLSSSPTQASQPMHTGVFSALLVYGQTTSLFDIDDTPTADSPTLPPLEPAPVADRPLSSGGGGMLEELVDDQEDLGKVETELLCDRVLQIRNGRPRTLNVELLGEPLNLQRREQEYLFTDLGASGKGKSKVTIPGMELRRVTYYEINMLERAANEVGMKPSELKKAGTRLEVGAPELVKRARRARWLLNEALAQHDSARQTFRRRGEIWDELRVDLDQALLNIDISLILGRIERGQTSGVLPVCDELHARHPKESRLLNCFAALLLKPAEEAFASGQHESARMNLTEFSRRYPNSSEAKALRDQMVGQARELINRARQEKNAKLLDQANEIWPQLAEIDAMRRTLIEEHPVLHCAFPTLPMRFSPLAATTTTERQIIALLFDRLVGWRPDQGHYLARLSATRPRPLPRAREFQLPMTIWSDSDVGENYLTSEDVRVTVELLRNHPSYFYPKAWSRMITCTPNYEDDPFRLKLEVEVDHWQPLSFMDFPILPRRHFPNLNDTAAVREALESFARKPVGTGPYRLHDEGPHPDHVTFVANPYFRELGSPRIRDVVESRLESAEAMREFAAGRVHLIYDLRREYVDQMRGRQVYKLPDRSVHFLAPNHQNSALKNENLRLAIAHAIPREEILQQIFRPSQAFSSDHTALNGPYPKQSWAYSPNAIQFDRKHAENHLRLAKSQLGGLPSFTLIYPDDNPDIGRACEEIRKRLQAPPLGLNVELESVEANMYHDRVVKQRRFDLAYWRHEFDDETYWLWPLLDPAEIGEGGANFMSFVPDQTLRELFDRLHRHKQFRMIREQMQKTHEVIAKQAVVVPLWELDIYVALSNAVEGAAPSFESGRVFEQVENWTLRSR